MTTLHNTQKQFDVGDDMRIRISQTLNPEVIKCKIYPLKIERNNFEGEDGGFEKKFESLCFTIDQDVLSKLRQFQDYLSTLEGTTPLEKSSTFEDDEELSAFKVPSVNAVCLSAFGIILRHITGTEKFLVGVKQDYRTPDSKSTMLGPQSDVLPIKMDVSENTATLNALVMNTWNSLKTGKDLGQSCPSSMLYEDLGFTDLPIQYEFVSNSKVKAFESMGVLPEDLTHRRGTYSTETDPTSSERIWTIDTSHPFYLKLKIIDLGNELRCVFTWNREVYGSEKVFRWAEKFENTLWQVEYGARKLGLGTVISRLYNRVWQGSSASLTESLEELNVGGDR